MSRMLIFEVQSVELNFIKTNPPKLLVHACGLTTSLGWRKPRLELREPGTELSADGVLDLNFTAKPPKSPGRSALDVAEADFVWETNADKVRAVIVYAKSGSCRAVVGRPHFSGFVPGRAGSRGGLIRQTTNLVNTQLSPVYVKNDCISALRLAYSGYPEPFEVSKSPSKYGDMSTWEIAADDTQATLASTKYPWFVLDAIDVPSLYEKSFDTIAGVFRDEIVRTAP